jgi:hypothetical protein
MNSRQNLRDKINVIKEDRHLSDECFQLVRLTKYRPILHSILEKFTILEPSQINEWWWDSFREPICRFHSENVFDDLEALINKEEVVWLAIEDDEKTHEKYWLFEGKIQAIISILKELPYVEYYIVSKKLEWILCENHHNLLIGAGKPIVEKLKLLKPNRGEYS